MSLLSRRYGTALFLAARDKGVVDEVDEALGNLHTALRDPQLRDAATSPAVSSAQRLEVLHSAAKGSPELVMNLIETVHRRRREEVLAEVYPDFRALVMKERGEQEGVLETAHPLPELEFRKLQELASDLTGTVVRLTVQENPDLIGGVRMHVGNTLFDGSVATALEDLEKQLMRAQIH